MYINQTYNCDICLRNYNGQDSVRNIVSIENGAGASNYPMCCDKCAKVIIAVIDELKPVRKDEKE